eukprot:5249839-Prymnesium_polylepis.1
MVKKQIGTMQIGLTDECVKSLVGRIASEVALSSNSGSADQDFGPLKHAVENAVKNGYDTLRSQ